MNKKKKRLIVPIEARYNCNLALEIRDKARTTRHLFTALLPLDEEFLNEEHQSTGGDRQFLGRRRFCRQRRGAEPDSVYIGGTVGQAEFKDGCQGLAGLRQEGPAWRILGGYQFNRYFAAELGYHDLGKASAAAGARKGRVGAGRHRLIPIANQFSVYGKLGRLPRRAQGGEREGDEHRSHLRRRPAVRLHQGGRVAANGSAIGKMGGGAVVETDVDVLSVGWCTVPVVRQAGVLMEQGRLRSPRYTSSRTMVMSLHRGAARVNSYGRTLHERARRCRSSPPCRIDESGARPRS